MEDVDSEWYRAHRKLHLHARRVKRGGGGVVDQHSPQAEANQMVPPVVPGGTIGFRARLEGSIRVLPVSDEVRHRVHQTASTPPEG